VLWLTLDLCYNRILGWRAPRSSRPSLNYLGSPLRAAERQRSGRMTQKLSSNGSGLPKLRSKDELMPLFERELSLQPGCSVIDLDNPSNQSSCPPKSEVGVWVDTWHNFVDILGSSEDAEIGIRAARSILYDLSTRFANMLFSADASKPPLDQFGPTNKSVEMIFSESTCYTNIRPIAIYRGRKIYWGSEPSGKKLYLL